MPVELVPVESVRAAAERTVAAFERDLGARLPGPVEHIGATSLPAGHTKGDVDVNVRVPAERLESALAVLEERCAVAQPENWTPTFASFGTDAYELPLGVQVTVLGSEDDFLLGLRDRMRGDPGLAARYDAVKAEAAPLGPDAYWQAKDRFLRELLESS